MENSEKRYTIGQMAEICSMTTKQLRYYDEKHIISPCCKDENTGYRYYSALQLQELLLLKDLKTLDLPLKDISEILSDRDIPTLKRKLRQCKDLAETQLKSAWYKYHQTIEQLLRIEESIDSLLCVENQAENIYQMEVIEFPRRWFASSRRISHWNVNALFTDRRAEVYHIINKYRLQPQGVTCAIFHNGYMKQFSNAASDSEGDLEVCMAVSSNEDCPSCRKIGGFQALSTIHVGSYPSLKNVYEIMENWAKDHQIRLSDTSIEEYICGTTVTSDPQKYVTRIYVPLEGSII